MSHALLGLLSPEAGLTGNRGWTPSLAKAGAEAVLRRDHYRRRRAWSCHRLLPRQKHGITNVAVLEKSYLGSGNIGRNTTIIRSNYLSPATPPSTSAR